MPPRPEPPDAALAAPGEHLPFPVLLDAALPWTLRHLRTIYPWVALPAVVISSGVIALQLLWPGPDPRAQPLAAGLHNCSYILFYLPLYWIYAALRVAAVDALAGRPVSGWQTIRFIARPRVVGTELLAALCVGASFLCCGLPFLYVSPLLALTMVAMAAEGVTGTRALRRSAELTRHNPERRLLTSPILKILALMASATGISYLLILLVELPFGLLQGATILRKIAAGEDLQRALVSWVVVPVRGIEALSSTAVQLYVSFALALLFFDLREQREGAGLRRAVGEMAEAAGEPGRPAPPPASPPPAPSPPWPASPGPAWDAAGPP
jgi:hypothetical protein